MEKYNFNSYEGSGPDKQEIIRLKDEKWSQAVSISFLDDVVERGTRFVDIGSGSSMELEKWIRGKGGEYLAVDSSNEILDARADSGEQFDVTMLVSADDLSKIEDGQFDISHMKLVLMHLSKEKRLKAISEAIRVAKGRAFFLDADWSGWGGTESVEEFVKFIQENINKYRIVDNYIGQKMLAEIEGVAKEKNVDVGRVITFKQEKGDHYHYLTSLAKGTYTKLIEERVEDESEKQRLLTKLNELVGKLEKDREAGIPIEIASLVGVEVLIDVRDFDVLSEKDFDEILKIQESITLENIENKENIERKGFIVNPLTKEELGNLIKNPERTHSVVYRKNGIQTYAIGFDIGLWKELRPYFFEQTNLNEEFEFNDSDYHLIVGSTGKEAGSGMNISREFFKQVKEKGVEFVSGNIAEKPYLNKASVVIHKRLGCERVGEVTQDKDGQTYTYGVFVKNLKS